MKSMNYTDVFATLQHNRHRLDGCMGFIIRLNRQILSALLYLFYIFICLFIYVFDGVSRYYKFCGLVLESDGAFEGKVGELCRELGERGKAKL
eukprot:COSAG05_NODE_352_length_10911_cov_31.817139_4_plen_93_part_00